MNLSAITFNGTTTSINCGNDISLRGLNASSFTAECWCYVNDSGAGSAGRFARMVSKDNSVFFYISEEPELSDQFILSGFVPLTTTSAARRASFQVHAGGWYHMAMTWDFATKTMELFVNGNKETAFVDDTTGVGDASDDSSTDLIVGNNAANDREFDGGIAWLRISDNIRYTDRFIPPAINQPPATDANTVLLLGMSEGSGTSVADSSGNSNDGTLANGAWETISDYLSQVIANVHINSDTTYSHTSNRVPHQRNIFYASGRWWLFYGDYDAVTGPFNLYFTSTADLETWATPSLLTTFHFADAGWSIYWDSSNAKLHIAKNIGTVATVGPAHDGLLYRRGEPQSDGSISWDADWQTVIEEGTGVGDFSLQVDSSGYAWVGYGTGDTRLVSPDPGVAMVIKNSATDGTWSTAAGFPSAVSTGATDDAFAILAPLTDGEMYAAVYEWNQEIQCRGYVIDASGSVTTDTTTLCATAVEASSGTGAKVARMEVEGRGDGVVHLVYQDTSQNIKYNKRSAAGSWGTEVTVSDNTRVTDSISSPRITFGSSNRIWCMWSATDLVYVSGSGNDGVSFTTPAVAADFDTEDTYEHAMPSLEANGDDIAFMHSTSSGVRINFHLLSTPDIIAPTLSAATFIEAGTKVRLRISETVTGTLGWSFDSGTFTHESGDGTNEHILAIDSGSPTTISYDQGTGNVVDGAGNELETVTNQTISRGGISSIPLGIPL